MAIGSAGDTGYVRLREHLAATGVVVVGVEFRNSGGKLGPHPFPAGLNDCAAAVRWAAANRAELGITHLIVSGESGGGNLTLTVAHKAKREGWLHEVAGFYAQCPFISNRWLDECEDLPSLTENDEYFVTCQQLALLGSLYDPDQQPCATTRPVGPRWPLMTNWRACRRMSSRSTNWTRCATRGCSTTAGFFKPGCRRWAEWSRAPAMAATCYCRM